MSDSSSPELSGGYQEKLLAGLEVARRQGRQRQLEELEVCGVHVITSDGQRLLNFGGNDYLGVVAGQTAATGKTNVAAQAGMDSASTHDAVTSSPSMLGGAAGKSGATASPLVCGWSPHHERLAVQIARLERTESAVVFPSGYAACSGSIATLCREGDLILSDQLNHASLIDGCRASKAECVIYPHRDLEFVETTLRSRRDSFSTVWIVTDTVFSMDGNVAPLAQLVDLAERYRATMIVDEAHGTGVLGKTGGGLCEALQVQAKVAVRIGTLSKAIGHQGGFVAGTRVVTNFLTQFCRPLIFSTALSPVVAESAARTVEVLPNMSARRRKLAGFAGHFRTQMRVPASELEQGIPIVPVIIGSDEATVELSKKLREAGFYVPAIRPPTVPENTARLRVSISAAHTIEQIDQLIMTLKKFGL
ncbi:8-amino-7-oxononanoate synthase [Neorhodopirellula lusitana]|uniref:8-amino-7-oxononanoate synthase n=1 Tax=Neorhodopirellula lusitana TaxID=445327 RepID=A0ABY1QMU4_9BACT|nr:8-amino-7-oxononanoate synthase [Neorhodopirellula lusitana]SMP75820.1 8-amino-7-oxononanoate synthase [Neorhodopirellula lusitana]